MRWGHEARGWRMRGRGAHRARCRPPPPPARPQSAGLPANPRGPGRSVSAQPGPAQPSPELERFPTPPCATTVASQLQMLSGKSFIPGEPRHEVRVPGRRKSPGGGCGAAGHGAAGSGEGEGSSPQECREGSRPVTPPVGGGGEGSWGIPCEQHSEWGFVDPSPPISPREGRSSHRDRRPTPMTPNPLPWDSPISPQHPMMSHGLLPTPPRGSPPPPPAPQHHPPFPFPSPPIPISPPPRWQPFAPLPARSAPRPPAAPFPVPSPPNRCTQRTGGS